MPGCTNSSKSSGVGPRALLQPLVVEHEATDARVTATGNVWCWGAAEGAPVETVVSF